MTVHDLLAVIFDMHGECEVRVGLKCDELRQVKPTFKAWSADAILVQDDCVYICGEALGKFLDTDYVTVAEVLDEIAYLPEEWEVQMVVMNKAGECRSGPVEYACHADNDCVYLVSYVGGQQHVAPGFSTN